MAPAPPAPRRRRRRAALRSNRSWAQGAGLRPEGLAGDGDVVEGDLAPVLELLALLVALAGDHHDVARARCVDGAPDRLAAVDHHLDAVGALDPGHDFGDDRL